MIKLLVSNLSSQGNSIVEWKAWRCESEDKVSELKVMHGRQTDSKTGETDYEFNVTPINTLPHGTATATMVFFDIMKTESETLKIKIQAKDMYGKKHSCIVTHSEKKSH